MNWNVDDGTEPGEETSGISSPEPSVLTTQDEFEVHDAKATSTKKKRIRKRVADEMAYLRKQIDEYTHQLDILQKKLPMTNEISEWEGLSRRQAAERVLSEQENQKLRAVVENQLRVVETLVKLVSKRPKLLEETYLEDWKMQRLVANPIARRESFHAIVDAEYAKLENILIRKGMVANTWPSPIETDVVYDDVSNTIGFDCKMRHTLNVDYKQCADIMWQTFCVHLDVNLPTACFQPIETFDENAVYFKFIIQYEQHGIQIYNHTACKRYFESNRVVLVLTSILDDELVPYPSHAYVARETGWIVVSNVEPTQCTVQYYSRGTMPCKTSRDLDLTTLSLYQGTSDSPHRATHMALAEFMMTGYKNNLESMCIYLDHCLLSIVDPNETKLTVFETKLFE